MKLTTHLMAAALVLASPLAFAHDYRVGELEIGHPWARATLPGAKVGGGYLTLKNEGSSAERLLGGTSPVAGRVEVHNMEIKDGIMTMRAVSDGLEIPAGASVELAPGGYHLMLMELKQPLAEGERVPLTLNFEQAGSVDVELAVGPAGGGHGHDEGSAPSHNDAHAKDGGHNH